MIVAALVLFVFAVVIVATTVAAAGGILKPNTIAGIRLRSLLASREAWEAGHLAALLPMTVAGVIAVAGGLICLLRPGSGGVLIVTIILVLALIAWAIIRADRRARLL